MVQRELFPEEKSSKALEPKTPDRPHAKPVAKRIGKPEETFGQKFKRYFLADDVGDIGEYLVKDLIIPTVKETFMNFLAAALWGDRRNGGVYRDSSGRQRTNYNGLSRVSRVGIDRNRRDRDEDYVKEEKKDFDLDNIVLATREQADIVLTRMEDYMLEYGQVTVGYLLELLGESNTWTSEYYGWRNLDRASIRRVRNGHQLILPKPVRLER